MFFAFSSRPKTFCGLSMCRGTRVVERDLQLVREVLAQLDVEQRVVEEVVPPADGMAQLRHVVVRVRPQLLFGLRALRVHELQCPGGLVVQRVREAGVAVPDDQLVRVSSLLLRAGLQLKVLRHQRVQVVLAGDRQQPLDVRVLGKRLEVRHAAIHLIHIQVIRHSPVLLRFAVLLMTAREEVEVLVHELRELGLVHGAVHPLDGKVGHVEALHGVGGLGLRLFVVEGHDEPVFHILRKEVVEVVFRADLLLVRAPLHEREVVALEGVEVPRVEVAGDDLDEVPDDTDVHEPFHLERLRQRAHLVPGLRAAAHRVEELEVGLESREHGADRPPGLIVDTVRLIDVFHLAERQVRKLPVRNKIVCEAVEHFHVGGAQVLQFFGQVLKGTWTFRQTRSG